MGVIAILNILTVAIAITSVKIVNKKVKEVEYDYLQNKHKTMNNESIKDVLNKNLDKIAIEIDGELYDCYVENREINIEGNLENILIVGKEEY